MQERADNIARWLKLTGQPAQAAPIESKRADGRGHRQESGINAAIRDLGIGRAEAQGSIKIASITPEAARKSRPLGRGPAGALLQHATGLGMPTSPPS
jgi:hypothetical protein